MTIYAGIRLFIPMITAFILLVLSSMPISIAGASSFFPAVDIMFIYYWSSHRLRSVPDWFIFTLGILRDAVEGTMMGVSPLIYLVTKFIVLSSRNLYRRENFLIIWQGFAITALIAISGKCLLLSLSMDTSFVLNAAIMQFVVSIAMYPLLHWVFNIIQMIIPENFQDA
jgi:rod shape-determining protein MreD